MHTYVHNISCIYFILLRLPNTLICNCSPPIVAVYKHFINKQLKKKTALVKLNLLFVPAEKMFFSEHSCKICMSEVNDNDLAVLCDLCEIWVATLQLAQTLVKRNMKILNKLKSFAMVLSVCIVLQSSLSLQSIIKTFIALLLPVVPPIIIIIIMLHQR